MEKNFGQNLPRIADYAERVFKPQDATLLDIVAHSDKGGLPPIQVASMDGLHLEVLVRAFGARKAVEIGTLGGYSGTCIARALPADGMLYTFEFDPKHAAVAEENFERAGLKNRVRVFVGPALENLSRIEAEGPFDLVFIDADKPNYPAYLDWAMEHVRVGGVILGDNTFAWGHIASTEFSSDVLAHDPQLPTKVAALNRFNERLASDARFRATVLPTGEGLTCAVRVS